MFDLDHRSFFTHLTAILHSGLLRWTSVIGLSLLLNGCEHEPAIVMAYADADYNYRQTAELLREVLAGEGYDLTLVPVANAIEGAQLVASGQVDLSLIMDQTDLEKELGEAVHHLQTVLPLFRRVIYIFYRPELPETDRFFQLAAGRRIYAGTPGDEKFISFRRFMDHTGFSDYRIVTDTAEADIIFYWGDTNSERAEQLARRGWKIFSLRKMGQQGISLRLGRLDPFELPPTASMMLDMPVQTMTSNVLLLTSDHIDSDRTYHFAKALFNARSRMLVQNPIYEHMREDFDQSSLPYPLNVGMETYLRRDEPSFWERYAEVIALGFALLAGISGVVQSLRLWVHKRRKERLDHYLRAFAVARTKPDREKRLEEILDQALVQLTQERLEKEDFDILARLIYSEITAKNRVTPDKPIK